MLESRNHTPDRRNKKPCPPSSTETLVSRVNLHNRSTGFRLLYLLVQWLNVAKLSSRTFGPAGLPVRVFYACTKIIIHLWVAIHQSPPATSSVHSRHGDVASGKRTFQHDTVPIWLRMVAFYQPRMPIRSSQDTEFGPPATFMALIMTV
ncbi:hypothetical protein Mapa_010153 [Marchantia paleacea]|nr:hypothetical protein Mapa_010153 [Marchantia paleacea]